MKKFFRERKLSFDSKTKPVLAPAAPASTSTSTPSTGPAETPLYARFASLHRSHDHGGPSKPVVSGPMQLSSKPSLSRTSANGTAPAKSKEGIGRILSRNQESSKPNVLHKRFSRNSQEVDQQALNGMYSKSSREEQRASIVASPPRQIPRQVLPEPISPVRAEPQVAFPHKLSQEYVRNGFSPQGLVVPRMEWTPSQSTSSLTSGSDSILYSPLPKQLVVRNFDPENDSLASSVARPTHLEEHNHSQPVSSPPIPPKPLEVTSPFARSAPLHPSSLGSEPQNHTVSSPQDSRYPGPSRPALDHGFANGQNSNGSHNHSLPHTSNISSSASYSQPLPSVASPSYPARPLPSRPQDTHRHEPNNDDPPAAPPVRKVSLLSTPSVTRRKYSPLAAFGLPVSQVDSSTSHITDTSSSSVHDEKPLTDVNYGPVSAQTPLPEIRKPPLLPSLDVSPSTFEHSSLDIDFSNWRKTATESGSKRVSQVDSPAKQPSTIPSILSSPASFAQSQLPEIDEQEFSTNEKLNDATITASHPHPHSQFHPDPPPEPSLDSKPTYPAPVPVHPPTEPGIVASRLSASLHSTSTAYQTRASPSQPYVDLSTQDMPDVGETRFQRVEEPPPEPPMKSRVSHTRQDAHGNKVLVRAPDVPDPNTRYTPPDQHNGPVQGRPLIFAAMEATETSGAHDLRVDPRMIGFIGNASATKKTEEVHEFVRRHTGYQTPTSTPPPPPPEKEEKAHRKKLSKVRRDQPSRKVEDEVGRSSPTKPGSARTTIVRSPDEGESRTALHRSMSAANPTTTSALPTKSGSPPRVRDETERQGSDIERHARKRSVHTENKLNRRSRDGVKTLTEKQVEKLSNRKSYNGSPKLPEPPVSPPKRPAPVEQSPAYPPPPHKLSYRSTAPFIPTQPAEVPIAPISASKHSLHHVHVRQLSLTNGSGSRHTTSQLPTPPEENQATMPLRPRREKKSASPPSHRHHEHHDRKRASSGTVSAYCWLCEVVVEFA
ncbi:hypothetical protein BDY19DRAFT_307605 [Irpex rosettiformis]|uniref:Uncharacterized protein n=1 Tax=Irpex rosettiformis TaxID=378272 RepID=A0ACB8TYW3_9APHY|nr:hypothetical protein BDY19DRAFT_307605 [Irpex rosettiformis]